MYVILNKKKSKRQTTQTVTYQYIGCDVNSISYNGVFQGTWKITKRRGGVARGPFLTTLKIGMSNRKRSYRIFTIVCNTSENIVQESESYLRKL